MPDFNGGTVGGNILPDVTGRTLGSSSQLWDVYAQSLNVKTSNAIRLADQFAGADASVKINAAIADLPAGGGTVDCRALYGNQTISQTITITSKVNLIMPIGATWTVSITDGSPAIWLKSDCAMMSFGHGANNCYITLANTAHVSEVLKVGGVASATHVRVQGFHVYGNASATVDNALVNIPGLFDSQFYNLTISALNGIGLWIHDNGAGNNTEQLDFYSLLVDGSHTSGSRPVVIESNSSAQVFGIGFHGGDFGHPGSGQAVVEINGHGRDANGLVTFSGPTYMESNSGDTTTALVKIVDASQIVFQNAYFYRMSGSSTAYGIDISETLANLTYSIKVESGRVTGGTGNHFINNQVDSDSIIASANDASSYYFLNSERSGTNHLWRVGGLTLASEKTAALDKNLNFTEMAAPSGVASKSVLYADSTAHRLKVNPNNVGSKTLAWVESDTLTSPALTSPTIGGGTAITKVVVYSQSIDVASVNANTTAEQTFTVTGLTTADKVIVNKPSHTAGLGIVNARVSAADTLALTFGNFTASPIDPGAETYQIIAIRS